MKALVVGGGIAGIAVASALQHFSQWEVTLIEKAPEWKNVGFSLALLPGGTRVLDNLGLGEAFRQQSLPVEITNILDENGSVMVTIPFTPLQKYGLTATVERSTLHDILIHSLQKVRVCMHTAFEKVTQENFDLIIAADGLRSSTRTLLMPKQTLFPYHWHAWIFWLPSNISLPIGISQALSTKGAVYLFPTHNARTAIGITRKSNPDTIYAAQVDKKELQKQVGDMGPWVQDIISALPNEFECYQDELQYVRTGEWFNGKTVFIGDAQHGVSLISGIGASLALEDAWTLAEELRGVKTRDDIQPALRRFAARRSKELALAIPWIRHAERLAMTNSLILAWFRNKLIKLFPGWVVAPLERYLSRSL